MVLIIFYLLYIYLAAMIDWINHQCVMISLIELMGSSLTSMYYIITVVLTDVYITTTDDDYSNMTYDMTTM
jgi:uncharacterized membrane protein (DUF485 family)